MLVLLPFNLSSIANIDNLSAQPLIIWTCIAIILFSISAQIFRVKAFYTKDPSLIAPGMYFSVIVVAILDIVFYNISL